MASRKTTRSRPKTIRSTSSQPRSAAEDGPGGPRYGRVEDVIRLIEALASSHNGLTLREMQEQFEPLKERRTIERMRDAIARFYGDALVSSHAGAVKRFRLKRYAGLPMLPCQASELSALDFAIKRLSRDGRVDHADALRGLATKVRGLIDPDRRPRIEADEEMLLQAEGFVLRPGPRVTMKPDIMSVLRSALICSCEVRLDYVRRSDGKRTTPRVRPYGILSGRRHYLVASRAGTSKAVLFAIPSIVRADLLATETFERPPHFSLERFAENAFGVWQEDPVDVVWRFDARAARDAAGFTFHPRQTIETLRDGSIRVRFTAGGLEEMAWHLFTWGDTVTIERPKRLRTMLAAKLEAALSRHAI